MPQRRIVLAMAAFLVACSDRPAPKSAPRSTAPTVAAAPAAPTPAETLEERVERLGLDTELHECVSVADGDTLTLDGIGTVRLVGVDTPEKGHPTLPIQFLSLEASKFTRKLCLGKKIRLEYDPHDEDLRGNYGRVLGYAYLEDGTFLQEALIRDGYAIAYLKYPFDEARRAQFKEWENEARAKGIGLWADGGMAEVRWIEKQGHPVFEVFGMAHKKWGLRYGEYVRPRIEAGELEDAIKQLHTWIYEYSPRDLKPVLLENGYRLEKEERETP